MIQIFFFLSFLNIGIIFLIRFLMKRNIFLKKLAYITVIFQILVTVISVVRERNFETINFYVIFTVFSLSLITIFSLPLILNKLLSEQKKLELFTLESSIKTSLVETYHEFLESHSTMRKMCDFFSKNLLAFINLLVNTNKLYFFVWIPWLVFVNFFLLETVISQKFTYAPYFLAYFFVLYRLQVVLLFICKNTAAHNFIWPLRKKLKCFVGLDFLTNMVVLKNIVFNPKLIVLEDKIKNWKVFNEFLFYFIEAQKLDNLFYYDLSEVKKLIDSMNFSLVISISLFFVAKNYEIDSQNCLLIFLSFYTSLSYFFCFKLKKTPESIQTLSFKDLLFNLKEFHGHLKWLLIKEHQFSVFDAYESLKKPISVVLPISGRAFFIKAIFFHVFSLWILFFLNFFFDFWFKILEFFFSIQEPFIIYYFL